MEQQQEVVVVGSGIAGITAACLLAKEGFKVTVLEQNWLPGGCASSYPRKNYLFESGATTLVGLDPHMPLRHLLDELHVEIPAQPLALPMQVHLSDGQVLNRHQDIEAWIAEAERVFGPEGQRPFWEYCFRISQRVWQTSLQQRHFPPSNLADLWQSILHFRPSQLPFATLAFRSMKQLLKQHGLLQNRKFVSFVNEQLLITAQNYLDEVNVLFGATALCYTNFGNYYLPGGMIQLSLPLIQYLERRGGTIKLRESVQQIEAQGSHYLTRTKNKTYRSRFVVSAIPINNTLEIFTDSTLQKKYQRKLLASEQLNSAFSLGLAFKQRHHFSSLHHQIHLETPLPYINAKSIFLSLSDEQDRLRSNIGERVASISTHISDPGNRPIPDKQVIVDAILDVLEQKNLIQRSDILYQHASTAKAWEKWTQRSWGFVGGYPQYFGTKPWQMLDARLDHKGAYICGDSTYPGQGIPGACLSGIIAYEKLRLDAKGPQTKLSPSSLPNEASSLPQIERYLRRRPSPTPAQSHKPS